MDFYLDIIRKFVPFAAESVHTRALSEGHQQIEARAVAIANDKQPMTPLKSSKIFKHPYFSDGTSSNNKLVSKE